MKISYIIILSLLLFGCGNGGDDNKKDQSDPQSQQPKEKGNTIIFDAAQIKNGNVDTGHLAVHKLSGYVHVNGLVDVPPEDLISINVPLGGFLKQTDMLPGQPVRKGQVLATIENQDYITIQQELPDYNQQDGVFEAGNDTPARTERTAGQSAKNVPAIAGRLQ